LGGLLTNFQTIQKSIKRLKEIEAMQLDGRAELLTKKERIGLDRERESLERICPGIKNMNRLPDSDLYYRFQKGRELRSKRQIAWAIPVIAVVDTNCDPDGVDYVIPEMTTRCALFACSRQRFPNRFWKVSRCCRPRKKRKLPKLPPQRLPLASRKRLVANAVARVVRKPHRRGKCCCTAGDAAASNGAAQACGSAAEAATSCWRKHRKRRLCCCKNGVATFTRNKLSRRAEF